MNVHSTNTTPITVRSVLHTDQMFSCSLEKTPNSEKKKIHSMIFMKIPIYLQLDICKGLLPSCPWTLFIIIFPRDPCVLPSSLHSEKPNAVRALWEASGDFFLNSTIPIFSLSLCLSKHEIIHYSITISLLRCMDPDPESKYVHLFLWKVSE